MDKIFSARVSESIIQRISSLARRLHTSKKSIIENAVTIYADQIDREHQFDVFGQTCGAWRRKESAGKMRRIGAVLLWIALVAVNARAADNSRGSDVAEWLAKIKDEDSGVRQQAAVALAKIRPVNATVISVLIQALDDREWEVQEVIVRELGQLGPAARAAAPSLNRLLLQYTGENSAVREETQLALVKINREPFTDGKWVAGLPPESKPVARALLAIRGGDVELLKRLYSAQKTLVYEKTGWDALMTNYRKEIDSKPVLPAGFDGVTFKVSRAGDPDQAEVGIVLDGKVIGRKDVIREGDEWYLRNK
jgi:hypothetical protein